MGEAHLCKARQASCLCRQDQQDQDRAHEIRPREEQVWPCREQEGEPSCQEFPMDRSRPEGPCSAQDQGFLSHQEGHSTLQEGQGALWPVKKSEYKAQGTSSRCGDFYICGAPEPLCE